MPPLHEPPKAVSPGDKVESRIHTSVWQEIAVLQDYRNRSNSVLGDRYLMSGSPQTAAV
jgi:hypothetical protein